VGKIHRTVPNIVVDVFSRCHSLITLLETKFLNFDHTRTCILMMKISHAFIVSAT